ncbi:MAG: Flp pilus assembly protein CpaB, partial [Planctomycetes bacterium]|nr:Flp pilus assembly protein CpaB [Planctomycetota bacterium]
MKTKSLVLLAVAAGCGLVSMLGVQQMLAKAKPTVVPKVKILVAKTSIDPGVPLDTTNVGFKEWPKDSIPEGAITKEEQYVERSLKQRVGPGQPIVGPDLGNKGEMGLEVQIPSGMTVQTYAVTNTMTHSGLLKPGNFVDVSAAIEYPQKGGGKRTEIKPVLQCVQVIAVGNQVQGTESAATEGSPKDAKNVSFLVFPVQGQLLQLAYKKSNGSIQLALRGKTDKTVANVRDLTEQQLSMMSSQLFGETDENKPKSAQAEPEEVEKPKTEVRSFVKRQANSNSAVTAVGDQPIRRTWKIEIYQGDKREVQEIDWPEDEQAKRSPSGIGKVPSAGWAGPLMKMFSGRSKKSADSLKPVDSASGNPNTSDRAGEASPPQTEPRQPQD